MSEADKVLTPDFGVSVRPEETEEEVKEKLRAKSSADPSSFEPMEVGPKATIDEQALGAQIEQAMQVIDRAQDAKLQGIIDGVYELHKSAREDQDRLARAHNRMAGMLAKAIDTLNEAVGLDHESRMSKELEALKTRVAELEAEKADHERKIAALIEHVEEVEDRVGAHEAIEEMERSGEKPVPWEQVKKELGL